MDKNSQENSRQNILNAAVKLFAKKGFDGVSIREICKEAGINICMISYYFGGKKELYQAIIDGLLQRQSEYTNTFLDLNRHPSQMTKQEQIDLFMLCLDKMVDFFYANITNDLITLLLKEQQNPDFNPSSPVLSYIRQLLACILDKDVNDKTVIFKMVFIISQINSPRILPVFSLRRLGQDEFSQDDINIIKGNVKMYVKAVLKEAGIV